MVNKINDFYWCFLSNLLGKDESIKINGFNKEFRKIDCIQKAIEINKNNDIYWYDLANLIEKDVTIKISGFENELCLRDI